LSRRGKFKGGKQKKCGCQSGLDFKNCHGKPQVNARQPILKKLVLRELGETNLPTQITSEANAGNNSTPWGIPGEELRMIVYPIRSYAPDGSVPLPSPDQLAGKPGYYKVQILLNRPGYAVAGERDHSFIDNVIGSSHLLIAKPKRARAEGDPDRIAMQSNRTNAGKTLFIGLANDDGYLGKFVAESIWAQSTADAERRAYGALSPFLSAWSLNLDIPLHVETVQVTELSSFTNTLRVRTPQFEISPGARLTPYLSEDFCKYASVYREGMNSESPFYRFLCLYKIIESVRGWSLVRSRLLIQ
jgi:hypothetical protein